MMKITSYFMVAGLGIGSATSSPPIPASPKSKPTPVASSRGAPATELLQVDFPDEKEITQAKARRGLSSEVRKEGRK